MNFFSGKCWLLEHCLALIDGQSGFPLTLECLLVIGEVARSNIRVAQSYLQNIVQSVCRKLLTDQDSGIQIRCAKALALVGASILQEMEKEDNGKDIFNIDFKLVQASICSFCYQISLFRVTKLSSCGFTSFGTVLPTYYKRPLFLRLKQKPVPLLPPLGHKYSSVCRYVI